MRRVAVLVLPLLMIACGAKEGPPPEHADRGDSDHDDSEHDSARGDRRHPVSPNVEVVNSCAQGVPIYLGEEPNGTTGTHVTLRGGSTSHLSRDEHGDLILWIVDDKGFGKAHVRATKRMRKIEIGASCDTLHAE